MTTTSETNGVCLTASEFFGLAENDPVPVDLPGGHRVYVRGMTADERDAMEWRYTTGFTDKKPPSIRAYVVLTCCCDADGKPVFGNKLYAQQLAGMPSKVLEPVFDAAREASGITEDDIENMEKNSEPVPS